MYRAFVCDDVNPFTWPKNKSDPADPKGVFSADRIFNSMKAKTLKMYCFRKFGRGPCPWPILLHASKYTCSSFSARPRFLSRTALQRAGRVDEILQGYIGRNSGGGSDCGVRGGGGWVGCAGEVSGCVVCLCVWCVCGVCGVRRMCGEYDVWCWRL